MGTITPPISTLRLIQSFPGTLAGQALINGTPTFISWTAPNDGVPHRFMAIGSKDVTVAETGGAVNANWTLPDGTTNLNSNVIAGNRGLGAATGSNQGIVAPGTTVTIKQGALTAGASVIWVDLYAA